MWIIKDEMKQYGRFQQKKSKIAQLWSIKSMFLAVYKEEIWPQEKKELLVFEKIFQRRY